MSTDLTVGPPGTTVLTSDLEQYAQGLDVVLVELTECRERLLGADQFVSDQLLWQVDAPYSAVLAEIAQGEAIRAVSKALTSSEAITTGLRQVIATYDLTEEQLSRAHDSLFGLVGYGLGWVLPTLALLAAPLLVPSLLGQAVGFLALPEDRRRLATERLLGVAEAKAGVLTDPVTVELVRTVVSSADDGIAGLTRVPLGVAAVLGDEGLGVTGIATATAAVGGLGTVAGMFRESPVAVRAVTTEKDVAPASGAQDRVERIPDGDEQIRIDRYSRPGQPDRVEVYVAGTAALGAVTGGEPLDMTSNLKAMTGGSAGSMRALEEAMALAGVTADTEVVFTGYSQGGLVAAHFAASGDWNTVGLVTVGAPAGQVSVPHDVPYLAIEHTDDLVPALGGRFDHSQPLVARRRCFDGAVDVSDAVLPAHDLDAYVRTAGLVDAEQDVRIHSLLSSLDSSDATVTSTMYRADRVQSTAPSGGGW